MAEYIEREALIGVMINGLFPNKQTETEFDVLRTIEQAPAANVVEVRHGEWKTADDFFECSNCGFITDWRLSNYCPDCGAKMD